MRRTMMSALAVGAALAAAGCNRGDKAANTAATGNQATGNASVAMVNSAAPAGAQATADEAAVRALLERIYARYASEGAEPLPWAETFEPRLAAALDSEEGAPEADPYTGAQDSAPFQARYDGIRIEGDRAEATARFTNMANATEVGYQLVRTPAGWRIEDIRTATLPSLRERALGTAG